MRRRPGSTRPPGRGDARHRLAEEIREKVALILLRGVGDRRLTGVHLTAVELSSDLSHARLLFRTTPGGATVEEATEGGRQAAGYLRRELARSLHVRRVPELSFELDATPDDAARVETLLRTVLPPPSAGGGEDR